MTASILVTTGGLSACGGHSHVRSLKLIDAGSLIVPFNALAGRFHSLHPDIDVLTESHGSIQVIRHVTELHEPQDVVATADYALLPAMMYHRRVPGTDRHYADWYIKFATNRMVLAYSPRSRFAGQVTARNWYQVVSRTGVKFGLADPRFDAAGYRALMVLQLAEHYYHDPVILENLMIGQFDQPITVSTRAGIDTVHVPEILEPVPGASLMVRGSSVELVALLESGDLDFTFEYESVVKQHGLRYVQLPPQIDLGDARWDKSYAHVAVKIDYQRFATVVPVFRGEAIAYALTIPSNAPDPAAARAFVAFALGPEGRRILKRYHQPVIVPPVADGYDHLPAQLRAVCSRPH